MKILALIVARAGSKRLPEKNTRLLDGKPLVLWSIDVVKNISMVCDILISTDCEKIANICRTAGGYVPWLRPPELATDQASSVEVAIHALSWYEANHGTVDGLLLLQPTSPFRTPKNVLDGISLFATNEYQPVLSVSLAELHPLELLKIENKHLVAFVNRENTYFCEYQQSPAYKPNGSIYLISPADLRLNKSFSRPKAIPLIISSRKESLDIDTADDFKMAEFFLEHK